MDNLAKIMDGYLVKVGTPIINKKKHKKEYLNLIEENFDIIVVQIYSGMNYDDFLTHYHLEDKKYIFEKYKLAKQVAVDKYGESKQEENLQIICNEILKLAKEEEMLRQKIGVTRNIMLSKISMLQRLEKEGKELSETQEEFIYNIKCMMSMYPIC